MESFAVAFAFASGLVKENSVRMFGKYLGSTYIAFDKNLRRGLGRQGSLHSFINTVSQVEVIQFISDALQLSNYHSNREMLHASELQICDAMGA